MLFVLHFCNSKPQTLVFLGSIRTLTLFSVPWFLESHDFLCPLLSLDVVPWCCPLIFPSPFFPVSHRALISYLISFFFVINTISMPWFLSYVLSVVLPLIPLHSWCCCTFDPPRFLSDLLTIDPLILCIPQCFLGVIWCSLSFTVSWCCSPVALLAPFLPFGVVLHLLIPWCTPAFLGPPASLGIFGTPVVSNVCNLSLPLINSQAFLQNAGMCWRWRIKSNVHYEHLVACVFWPLDFLLWPLGGLIPWLSFVTSFRKEQQKSSTRGIFTAIKALSHPSFTSSSSLTHSSKPGPSWQNIFLSHSQYMIITLNSIRSALPNYPYSDTETLPEKRYTILFCIWTWTPFVMVYHVNLIHLLIIQPIISTIPTSSSSSICIQLNLYHVTRNFSQNASIHNPLLAGPDLCCGCKYHCAKTWTETFPSWSWLLDLFWLSTLLDLREMLLVTCQIWQWMGSMSVWSKCPRSRNMLLVRLLWHHAIISSDTDD